MACVCSEKRRPMQCDLPKGSNERPRQWFVYRRNRRHFKSAGPFGSNWSAFSQVYCRVCDRHWQTKADYAAALPDCEYWPSQNPPRVEAIEV